MKAKTIKIQDKALEPFLIEYDGTQYTVLKRVTTTIKSPNPGTKVMREVAYFYNLPNALNKIVLLKNMDKDQGLFEYVNNCSRIAKELKGIIESSFSQ